MTIVYRILFLGSVFATVWCLWIFPESRFIRGATTAHLLIWALALWLELKQSVRNRRVMKMTAEQAQEQALQNVLDEVRRFKLAEPSEN